MPGGRAAGNLGLSWQHSLAHDRTAARGSAMRGPLTDGRHANTVKRLYYFTAGVALGVAATRRTRRAKEAAKAAFIAKFTPSAIAADVADAIAEIGQAVGSFASDIRMGAVNRRASYRPMVDGATGDVVMLPPEQVAAITERRALASGVIPAGDAASAGYVSPPRGYDAARRAAAR